MSNTKAVWVVDLVRLRVSVVKKFYEALGALPVSGADCITSEELAAAATAWAALPPSERYWASAEAPTPLQTLPEGGVCVFPSGATRSASEGKPDYEGYLSPLVVKRFGQFMLKHQVQADGNPRSSDNWQKGITWESYIKSLFRHFVDLWALHRAHGPLTPTGENDLEEALCAIIFNAQGYLHETLKGRPR